MEDEEGNVSVEMTLRYAHLSPDHKRAAVEALGKRMDTKNRHPSGVSSPIPKSYSQ